MSLKHGFCLLFSLIIVVIGPAKGALPIYLYPSDSIPNSKTVPADYKETNSNGAYSMVTKPTLTPFFPKASNATNSAVLIIPGGGYEFVMMSYEGITVAQKFNSIGVTAFLLKYRLPNDRIMLNRSIGPLQDAQRAIQIIRQRAAEWNIDPTKIGVIGFSAGGHLASTLGTHLDTTTIENKANINLRPDFMILMYPVITLGAYTHQGTKKALIGTNATIDQVHYFSNELQVTSKTPPTFLAHATTDNLVPIKNSKMFEEALIKANVVCEKHYYPTGVHGFGMVSPDLNENLIDVIGSFMRNNGFMQPALSLKNLNMNDLIDFSAFPNPSIDHFSVRFKLPHTEQSVVLTLNDLSGKIIESFSQKNVLANQAYTHTFKANQLSEGVYMVRLTSSQKTHSIKLIKKNCTKKG